ncbi:hypothetical protein BKA57DRAFT_401487 [Linnemannia elongata]|nr:hypothetical protein BKA57DRAFT_401487 [Linnemannia elongata]
MGGSPFPDVYTFLVFCLKAACVLEALQKSNIAHLALSPTAFHWSLPESYGAQQSSQGEETVQRSAPRNPSSLYHDADSFDSDRVHPYSDQGAAGNPSTTHSGSGYFGAFSQLPKWDVNDTKLRLFDFTHSKILSHERARAPNNIFEWHIPGYLEYHLQFLAPEQTGRAETWMDHRTDIYGLGATLFTLLTMQFPNRGTDSVQILQGVLSRELPPLRNFRPDMPPVIDDILRKMTKKQFPLGKHDVSYQFVLPNTVFGRHIEQQMISAAISQAAAAYQHNNDASDSSSNEDDAPTPKMMTMDDDHYVFQDEIVSLQNQASAKISLSMLIRGMAPVARSSGLFAGGSFEADESEPYSAILSCIQSVLQQLLTQHTDALASLVVAIRTAFEPNSGIGIVCDLIPELKYFFNGSVMPESKDVPLTHSVARFHALILKLIRVISTHFFMTWLIDDIHYADENSIALLATLVNVNKRLPIVLIMTHRDTIDCLPLVVRGGGGVRFIKLQNPSTDNIQEFLATLLHRAKADVAPLAKVFCHKSWLTIRQLTLELYRNETIHFNSLTKAWEWESCAETLAHEVRKLTGEEYAFLEQRFRNLDCDTKKIIICAAVCGSIISIHDLQHLASTAYVWSAKGDQGTHPPHEELNYAPETAELDSNKGSSAMAGLQSALREGILAYTTVPDHVRFHHNIMRKVALTLLEGTDEKERLHYEMAKILLNVPGQEFRTANHVLLSLDLIKKKLAPLDTESLRAILSLAGEKSQKSGAQDLAMANWYAALTLLPENCWDLNVKTPLYLEALKLHIQCIEAERWRENFDEAMSICNTVLDKISDPIDRARVYQHQIEISVWAFSRPDEATRIAIQCLQELGLSKDISFNPSQAEIRKLYDETHLLLLSHMAELQAENPKVCKDPRINMMMEVLSVANSSLYYCNVPFLAVGVVESLKLVCEYGFSKDAGRALVSFALTHSTWHGVLENAYEVGKLAYRVCKDNHHVKFLFHLTVQQWGEHIANSIPALEETLTASDMTCDRLFHTAGTIHISVMRVLLGRVHLRDCMTATTDLINKHNEFGPKSHGVEVMQGILQLVKCLKGQTQSENPETIFDDNDFAESKVRGKVDKSLILVHNNSTYTMLKIMAAFVFGHYEFIDDITKSWHDDPKSMMNFEGTWISHSILTVIGLTLVNLMRVEQSEEVRERRRRQLLAVKDRMEKGALKFPTNHASMFHLIEAEMADQEEEPKRDLKSILLLYEKSIAYAIEGDFPLHRCIAYELAAKCHVRHGLVTSARCLLANSCKGYQIWGARGKVLWFYKTPKTIYSPGGYGGDAVSAAAAAMAESCLSSSMQSGASTTSSNSGLLTNSSWIASPQSPEMDNADLDVLDFSSVIEAMQVIASEIDLDLLLVKSLGVLNQSVGANRCCVIIAKDQELVLAVSQGDLGRCEAVKPPIEVSQCSSLFHGVINYVINTGTPCLLTNAQDDPRFCADEYLKQRSDLKTVLCAPIVHKGAMVGVLYMEAFPQRAFANKRMLVMNLLVQQLGISITNAMLYQMLPIKSPSDNKIIQWLTVTIDIDDQRRAVQLKSNFLANMSHELRTPFSGILGMLSLLRDSSGLSQEQFEFVDMAKASCEMLIRIVDDLLNFSKLEADKVTLEYIPLCFEEILGDVCDLLVPLASRKGLELIILFDSTLPILLIGDPDRIKQILMNLIGNAIKFSTTGNVIISGKTSGRVELEDESHFGDEVILHCSVRDQGIGLSPQEQKLLFVSFQQTDNGTTRKYGGTGLGLSICAQLIAHMNGKIVVDSEKNRGATFTFTAKLRTLTDFDQEQNPAETFRLKECEKILGIRLDLIKDKRILILSPNRDLREQIRRTLQDTISVEDSLGLEALVPFDFIVVDHVLDSAELDRIYPSPAIAFILLLAPTTETLRWILPPAAKKQPDEPEDTFQICRMIKPVRRLKLLQIFYNAIHQHSHPVIGVDDKSFPKRTRNNDALTLLLTPEERNSCRGKNVLVAEDDFVSQKILEKQLTKLGMNVMIANNGQEAVNQWLSVERGHYTIAIFDHHMPIMDGLAATRKVRALEREFAQEQNDGKEPIRIPIVGLSADIQQSTKESCIKAGMDEYMTKPLLTKGLALLIQRYCCTDRSHESEL